MSDAPAALRSPGLPEPLGVTLTGDGANVAVFSAHADAIEFCLFDASGERQTDAIRLAERTGNVFHAHVGGIAEGARYGLRAHGPFAPHAGHRFDASKLLVDPYALALDRPFRLHPSMTTTFRADGSLDPVDSAPFMPKAVLTVPGRATPWADAPSWPRTSIAELHIRGFSMLHPGVPVALRGTWAGLASPAALAHFAKLGISSIEVLPAAAWIDERHLGPLGLTNYWGYNPVAFMAPDPRLAPGGWAEIRAATAALNAAGIEVLLDVVYNHTGESDAAGPTLSLRGLDNASYFRLESRDPAAYVNDAGCGNILAADRLPVVRLVLDSLRAWAAFGGLNGFRFDLMTTLGRRDSGFDPAAPIIAAIEQDPLLRGLKLIAEPWDIGPGGYQVGALGGAWGEWNDKYRDDVRRFWRGDGPPAALATRLAGSTDLFWSKRRPSRSVNFVTAHDGLTLADLVAYTGKRNAANGEGNRDGTDSNWSWNNGTEGPSADPGVIAARVRDQRNLLATLILSRGTPMLGPGAELGQSQGGNNNAYAQDNASAWIDWSGSDLGLGDLVARLLALRAAHPALGEDRFLLGAPQGGGGFPDVVWQLPNGQPPGPQDWDHPASSTLIGTFCATDRTGSDDRVTLVLHAGRAAFDLTLPPPRTGWRWFVAIDTGQDGIQAEAGPVGLAITVAPRAVVVLVEKRSAPMQSHDTRLEDQLNRLADAVGIAPQWTEISGDTHHVSPETKRAMLAAMGLPATTSGEARDSLGRLAVRDARPLPDSAVGREGAPVPLRVVGERAPSGLTILRPDGSEERLKLDPADLSPTEVRAADGRRLSGFTLRLPAQPLGRHRLVLDDAPDAPCALAVAPRRCFLPDSIRHGERLFGVSTHLYTLRREGDGGIGDFTTLGRFAEGAARHASAFVGLNPMHAQFAQYRERASPYNPSDRRFLDPIYIDVTAPEILGEAPDVATMLEGAAALLGALRAGTEVDYRNVWLVKKAVLDAAFKAFDARRRAMPQDPEVRAFEAFVAAGGARLRRFCLFEALSEAYPGRPWFQWDEPLRHPGSAEVQAFAAAHPEPLARHAYQQWMAERQFGRAEAAGRAAGLSLGFYRDIAVGTAPDGAEAWAESNYFARGVSVGSPPDPFSADGQIWSLPPPSPIAEGAGETFAHLLEANMRYAGALRIDHAMGLQRLFWVPDGAKGADGAYVTYDLEANLAELALASHKERCLVIGEDLGTVPAGFRDRIAEADILSYRVLFFERDGHRFLPPEAYPAKAVACVSTHDLPTLAGWWEGAEIAERRALGSMTPEQADRAAQERVDDKRALTEALHVQTPADDDLAPLIEAAHRFVAATPSVLAVAQIDDIVGETIAVNLPGTDRERPNWRRRLAPDVETIFEHLPDGLPRRSPGRPVD